MLETKTREELLEMRETAIRAQALALKKVDTSHKAMTDILDANPASPMLKLSPEAAKALKEAEETHKVAHYTMLAANEYLTRIETALRKLAPAKLTNSQKIAQAIEILANYGQTDGEHHKQFGIAQALRILMGEKAYTELQNTGYWDEGIED